MKRISTGMPAVDEMLGGGLPLGTVTLLAGPAGCGKTTLTMQWAAASESGAVYSAEQPAYDLNTMADRLGIPAQPGRSLLLCGDCDLDDVLAPSPQPVQLAVVDTMNTLAERGNTAKVAREMMRLAREKQVAIVLLAHLKRDGELAGSQEVEHIVDACLSLDFCDDEYGTVMLDFAANQKSRYCRTRGVRPVYMRLTASGMAAATEPAETSTRH